MVYNTFAVEDVIHNLINFRQKGTRRGRHAPSRDLCHALDMLSPPLIMLQWGNRPFYKVRGGRGGPYFTARINFRRCVRVRPVDGHPLILTNVG